MTASTSEPGTLGWSSPISSGPTISAPDPPGFRPVVEASGRSSAAMTEPRQEGALATRETYRALLLRGFTTAEAANLTAYLSGIVVGGGRPWRLADVDRLLFLRELCRSGRIGTDDGLQPLEVLAPAR